MFTLLIITLTVCAIVASIKEYNTKDKRSDTSDQKIQELPPIHIHSLRNSTGKKLLTMEFFESNNAILEDFNYNNGYLTLTMRNGKSITGLLSQMAVRFTDNNGFIAVSVKSNGKEVSFSKLDNFTADQWDTIINVLMLAGTTYGSNIFGSAYKNMKRANLVMKIISKL